MADVTENTDAVDTASTGVEEVVHKLRNSEQDDVDIPSDSLPEKKNKKKKKKKNSSSGVEATEMKKRDADEMSSDSPPKKKRKSAGGGDLSKNALQMLNELMPGLQYNCVSQTGPVHQPTFTVQVEVNGQVRQLLKNDSLMCVCMCACARACVCLRS